MINLYDHEVKTIMNEVNIIQKKYWGKQASAERLNQLQKEIIGRLEDLGFKAIVDPTPIFKGQPIDVRIENRVEPIEFDHDKKASEVRKSRELGGM